MEEARLASVNSKSRKRFPYWFPMPQTCRHRTHRFDEEERKSEQQQAQSRMSGCRSRADLVALPVAALDTESSPVALKHFVERYAFYPIDRISEELDLVFVKHAPDNHDLGGVGRFSRGP